MKKMLAMLMIIVMVFPTISVLAKETAVLPAFDVHFNGNKVESKQREYPLLVYKDITYFPMTYFDSRHLGIETEWDEKTNTLTISRTNINSVLSAYKSESNNPAKNDVSICNFNIIVNGKVIDNKAEPYPLLTFRDVTYFPLTWRFTVDEFGWEYSFDNQNGLEINSANHRVKMLDLSALEMNALYDGFTCDGEYYYHHNSANGNIYRTPVDDLSKQEVIHQIESGKPAGLNFLDGKVYLSYYSGGATMGTSHRYCINKDKTLTKLESPKVGIVSYYRAYGDGVTAELSFFTGTWEFCYYIGENKTEVEIPGVSFGSSGWHSSSEVVPPQIAGDNIYAIGYKGEEEIKTLISINFKSGEISEIASNVDNFEAYDTAVGKIAVTYSAEGDLYQYNAETKQISEIASNVDNFKVYDTFIAGIRIIYSAEGKLCQYITDTNELVVIDNDSKPLIELKPMLRKDISTSGIYIVTGDDEGCELAVYNGTLTEIMKFSAKTRFSYINGYLVVSDESENPKARLFVFDPWSMDNAKTPFISADDATAITIYGNTMIYRNVETGEFCEVKLKI